MILSDKDKSRSSIRKGNNIHKEKQSRSATVNTESEQRQQVAKTNKTSQSSHSYGNIVERYDDDNQCENFIKIELGPSLGGFEGNPGALRAISGFLGTVL